MFFCVKDGMAMWAKGKTSENMWRLYFGAVFIKDIKG